MSTSAKQHPTKKKASPAHAAHAAPDTPAEAGTEEQAATTSTIPVEIASTPAPADFATVAKTVSAALQQMAASIPFYDPSPNDLKAARASTRVPVAALGVAATILEQNPGRYPDFDVETTRDSADYVTAMTPVSEQMSALQLRLARSIFNRHGQGASETLALYQTLKGLSRVANGKDALSQQKALSKAMVKTSKKKRATAVTGKDLKAAAKSIKANKEAAAKNEQAATSSAEAQAANAAAKLANPQQQVATPAAAAPTTAPTSAATVTTPAASTTSTAN